MCDNSNVTGIVDRLEAPGLVERRPAEHDRRVKTVAMTEKGVELRRGRAPHERPPPPLKGLSEEDAAALRDILQRALGAAAGPPLAIQKVRMSRLYWYGR